jgi:hypothetical protein
MVHSAPARRVYLSSVTIRPLILTSCVTTLTDVLRYNWEIWCSMFPQALWRQIPLRSRGCNVVTT